MSGSRVLPGDVLLNITGASIGRACVVPAEVCPANVNQHVSIIRCKDALNPQFLSYYLATSEFQRFVVDSQAGATRQALTKEQIENFNIPVPEISEQKRIAAILNKQMAAVDKARIAAEYQASLASRICHRHLLSTFGEMAQSAPKTHPLEEVAHFLPSKSISTIGEATVEAVTTACLTEGGFDRRGVKTAQMAAKDVPDCVLSPGEILVARSNTPELVGRAAMFPGDDHPIVASDLTIRVQAGDRLLPEFLAGYLSYLYASGYWLKRSGGASGTMKKITRTQIAALPVPVPAIEAQRPVAAKMKDVFGAVSEVLRAIDENIAAISALPSALLRRAFSGGL